MDNIHLRMNLAEMAFQYDEIVDDMEFATRRFPECCDQLVPHVIHLMNSPVESVRAFGFSFAIELISQKPQTRTQLKEAFINKIQCNDLDVSRQAITLLPDFVKHCVAHAYELAGAALHASLRKVALNDVNDYIVEAMAIIGQRNEEDQSTEAKKEVKKGQHEDGEIS